MSICAISRTMVEFLWDRAAILPAMVDDTTPHGAQPPGQFDAAVLAMTGGLPRNWLGLRLAIALRRLVTMRLLGDDPGLDVERWGLKLRLHPLRNGCEKGLLFTPQFYEAEEREHLARQIDRVMVTGRPFVFVDIGANVGLFSLYVAAHAGGHARIVAIEPERENLRRLRFNLDANPGLPICVLPHALGDGAGSLAIELNLEDRGGTRTRPDDGSAKAVRVPCKTLLETLNEQSITAIDALKIDVEGAEDTILLPFFRDAPKDLWPRLLIIEDTRGLWRADLFAELKSRGYRDSGRSRQNVMMEW
jgi:FkbM family methyltransferase